jgi:hypothetical protein
MIMRTFELIIMNHYIDMFRMVISIAFRPYSLISLACLFMVLFLWFKFLCEILLYPKAVKIGCHVILYFIEGFYFLKLYIGHFSFSILRNHQT